METCVRDSLWKSFSKLNKARLCRHRTLEVFFSHLLRSDLRFHVRGVERDIFLAAGDFVQVAGGSQERGSIPILLEGAGDVEDDADEDEILFLDKKILPEVHKPELRRSDLLQPANGRKQMRSYAGYIHFNNNYR